MIPQKAFGVLGRDLLQVSTRTERSVEGTRVCDQIAVVRGSPLGIDEQRNRFTDGDPLPLPRNC